MPVLKCYAKICYFYAELGERGEFLSPEGVVEGRGSHSRSYLSWNIA